MSAATSLESRTASMRRALVRNLVLLTLLTAGTIVTVTLIAGYRSVQELSRSLIASAGGQTESRLGRFFDPVVTALEVSRGWAADGLLDLDDQASLNRLFIPVLDQLPAVSSVLVATTSGEEYMLLRNGDLWVNRRVKAEAWGGRSHWTTWRDGETRLKEEWRELDYDPRRRPWFQGAVRHAERGDASPFWTEPYTFFTTREPGMTLSSSVKARDGQLLVIGLDVLLIDISSFTTQMQVSTGGMAMVLTPDARVLGLPRHPRFEDREVMKRAVLSKPDELHVGALAGAVGLWQSGAEVREQIFQFQNGGESWWAGFQPFDLNAERRFWIGVAVPEEDFLLPVKRQRDQLILITLAALVLAVVVALLMDRSFRRKIQKALQAARQLGQYTLQEEIGSGAMGSVFRAQHAMLRRPTAIKLLLPDLVENEAAMARFEREAQLTSRLNHPHTIAIYDYGKTPDAIFYYAMEYLIGVDLQTLVRRTGRLPAARVIYILRQVSGSLDEAHGIGLIHRDVKPSNVMLTERAGDPDFVKVLDFGLVKEIGGSEEAELTNVSSLTGTPLYISPEAINDPRKVGPATDIYALGAMGYFLLTGKPVFSGQNLVDVCAKHLHESPQPPSERLGRPLPGDLETVILACLAKDPAQRPSSAGELSAMLGRCSDSTQWGPQQARRWWADHADLRSGKPPSEAAPRPTALAVDLKSRNP